ncbi:hypothetical protein HG263_13615 [Pseudoalteromonas sp. JBTF-M23]|uniref:Uncharacterized protein n=1 Tax=Pseudoalteromonas caenipelagi TaxID=2726988 RepID=A0A849VFQ0_9GAMM|nr:hypothetical protein [Pseudoalteromonas caenipelagi]NOU51568.1 hypothetical protein [Pseudoalteromonas caenipelagi]
MKLHTQLIILCFLAMLPKAASAKLLGCFDCSSVISKREAIEEFRASNKQNGKYEVVDVKNGSVFSYNIEYDPEFDKVIVFNASPSNAALSHAAQFSQEFRRLERSIANTNYTSNNYESVYKVYNDRKFSELTNEYILQSTVIDQLGIYVGSVVASVGKLAVGVNIVIDIGFSDGSVIRFKVSGINVNGQPEFEPISGKDSDGNAIPTSRSHLNGTYQFSRESGNWERFVELSRFFGVDVFGWHDTFYNRRVFITDCPSGACSIQPN